LLARSLQRLYDLTSTYFESDPAQDEADKRRFGYSRDKRSDCVQVVIALVVTPEGLSLAYEVMAGNTTLRGFLAKIEAQYGKARRVFVMERGIPTEAVLAEMRQSDPPVRYLVGTPKGRLSRLAAEWLVKQLNGKGNIIVLNGPAGVWVSDDRRKGADPVFKDPRGDQHHLQRRAGARGRHQFALQQSLDRRDLEPGRGAFGRSGDLVRKTGAQARSDHRRELSPLPRVVETEGDISTLPWHSTTAILTAISRAPRTSPPTATSTRPTIRSCSTSLSPRA
jgi:hypothetical protein